MWDSMQKFKEFLPQDAKQEFSLLVVEGKSVARASSQAALDAAVLAARSMALAMNM